LAAAKGRLGGRGLAWSAIGLSALGLVVAFLAGASMAVMYPVFTRAREAARTASCINNVRQLTLGVLMYAASHGDKLPPADTWSDDILPYLENDAVFKCPDAPALRSAYAYNRALAGMTLNQIPDPARMVLIYESNLGWNGAGGPESMVSPPRHFVAAGKGVVVGFVDGHVNKMASEQVAELVWQPAAAPAGAR